MSQTNQGRNCMVQGRIVWTSGNLFTGKQKKDQNTKQPRFKTDGTPLIEYGFGLAVDKRAFAQMGPGQPGEIWVMMHAEAQAMYNGGQIPPSFAMKYKDGDVDIDENGKPYSLREGYAGHMVFACTTSQPIKFCKWENGGNIMINEGIKCGDYVNVQLNIKSHPANGPGKAGLYLNPNAVQFTGWGKEIINTPTGDQIFGIGAPALPPGASATPVAQPGFLQPVGQQVQQPGYPPQPAYPQQPPAAMPQMPGPATMAPQPHFGVLPQNHQPPPGGQPAYPPMGNVPQPAGFPAPGVAATPMGAPTAPPFAVNAAPQPNGQYPPQPQYPGMPAFPQQPGYPAQR